MFKTAISSVFLLIVLSFSPAQAFSAVPGLSPNTGIDAARKSLSPNIHKIACGWYVVSGCYRDSSAAVRRANRIGGYVVNTSSSAFPNFNPGWYCAVFGPYNKSTASKKSGYVKPSYIKNGC